MQQEQPLSFAPSSSSMPALPMQRPPVMSQPFQPSLPVPSSTIPQQQPSALPERLHAGSNAVPAESAQLKAKGKPGMFSGMFGMGKKRPEVCFFLILEIICSTQSNIPLAAKQHK